MPYTLEQEAPDKWVVYDADTKAVMGEADSRMLAMRRFKELVRKEDAGQKEQSPDKAKKKKAADEDEEIEEDE